MSKILTTEMLSDAVSEACKPYGYNEASAEFVPFKEFKVQWSRSFGYIHFRFSDYLKTAPENVIKDLSCFLMEKINGEDNLSYSEELREFALADSFLADHRETYLSRSRAVRRDGTVKNLEDSLTRLEEAGLIESGMKIMPIWRDEHTGRAANCSVLFRVITVLSELDSEQTPDYILDYVIYIQYLKIKEGRKVFGISPDVDLGGQERKFPQYREAERWLYRKGLGY